MILNDGFGKLEMGMTSSLFVRLGTTTIFLIVDPGRATLTSSSCFIVSPTSNRFEAISLFLSYARFKHFVTFDLHLHILRSSLCIAIGRVESAISNLVGIALGMALLSRSVLELSKFCAFCDL